MRPSKHIHLLVFLFSVRIIRALLWLEHSGHYGRFMLQIKVILENFAAATLAHSRTDRSISSRVHPVPIPKLAGSIGSIQARISKTEGATMPNHRTT